jgi:hypothetical protein
MESCRIIGRVDALGQLTATVPGSIDPGEVEVVVIARPGNAPAPDLESDDAWMRGVAREWHDDLADPGQDIYTLEDGVPSDGTR